LLKPVPNRVRPKRRREPAGAQGKQPEQQPRRENVDDRHHAKGLGDQMRAREQPGGQCKPRLEADFRAKKRLQPATKEEFLAESLKSCERRGEHEAEANRLRSGALVDHAGNGGREYSGQKRERPDADADDQPFPAGEFRGAAGRPRLPKLHAEGAPIERQKHACREQCSRKRKRGSIGKVELSPEPMQRRRGDQAAYQCCAGNCENCP
jgi:hypothetical protein